MGGSGNEIQMDNNLEFVTYEDLSQVSGLVLPGKPHLYRVLLWSEAQHHPDRLPRMNDDQNSKFC